ncbi:universal stress protein [Leptobacterium sp. I13]|uniref:universal stress protein n=1 Tax=Leptobacterium meishanense TaxID=3128904 RepID=UPI0030ED9F58
MKNILVPVGASKTPESTIQYAIDFAAYFNARVYVLGDYNVISRAGRMQNIDEIIEEETKTYLKTCLSKVDKRSVDVATVTAKGNIIDLIKNLSEELAIDLVIIESNSNIKEEVFLDTVSGSIVKQTEIPLMIVPGGYGFKEPSSILTAFRSGILKRENVLKPLKEIREAFNAQISLLLVKTPKLKEKDLILAPELKALSNKLTTTENATTFQGVLEHFQEHHPDILCVFRRKRGFFTKLWEKNIILKREFHCSIPLLVLIGKL